MENSETPIVCGLCGSDNHEKATHCKLCKHELGTVTPTEETCIETIDESAVQVSPKRVALTVALLLAIAIPWFLMSDLVSEPKDLHLNRMNHKLLQGSYEAQAPHWQHQKEQVLQILTSGQRGAPSFSDVPLEIMMAYFTEDLGLSHAKFPELCWFPSGNDEETPQLILSRPERLVGPVSIMVSLEVSFIKKERGYAMEFTRLRRGLRDVSPDLAWGYFSEELTHLQPFQSLLGSITDMRFFQRSPEPGAEESGGYFSWATKPRSIPKSGVL